MTKSSIQAIEVFVQDDLSDEELAGFAMLSTIASTFVRAESLAAMVRELRRHRVNQLSRAEAHVLQYAASLTLAAETDPDVRDALGSAMAKLMTAEIAGML